MPLQKSAFVFTQERNILNRLNLKYKKTRHGNIKMIKLKVLDALRQLKYMATWCEKWHCLPPVSCLTLGTKGIVARWSNWPKCSSVKQLSMFCHMCAGCLSAFPHLILGQDLQFMTKIWSLLYFTKLTLYS